MLFLMPAIWGSQHWVRSMVYLMPVDRLIQLKGLNHKPKLKNTCKTHET